MLRVKNLIIASVVIATLVAFVPSEAKADGPLRKWLRGLWGRNAQSCNTCATPNPYGYYQPQAAPQTTTANYAPNAYGLQPGQCMKTCQQTCSRTVVNYVPQTAYRTTWNRVPVTQYKPVTNSDPVTGCTVTCMRPCTSYTYQCQRVPYTTYRPVYRQESYKVPVTTITNDCATGNCNTGCNTCNTGVAANQVPNFAPTPASPTTTNYPPVVYGAQTYAPAQTYTVPPAQTTTHYELPQSGTIVPGGSYGTPSAADSVPSVNSSSLLNGVVNPQSSQRPFLERFNSNTSGGLNQASRTNAPARIDVDPRTAQSPARKQWNYSPVRMASFSKPASATTRASYAPQSRGPAVRQKSSSNLNGWVEQ